MPPDARPVYEFGDFRLDVGERQLLRGGQSVPLRAKLFDTLGFLVEHSGRLLTKDELMRGHLARHRGRREQPGSGRSSLRRDAGRTVPRVRDYIETVPRVGYRFVAHVTRAGCYSSTGSCAAIASSPTLRQIIRFCSAVDGARIAYSTVGSGPRW